MFTSDRARMRETFVRAWRRHLERLPMEPLEAQIADVVAMHPEYHPVIEDADAVHRDFPPESGQTNPFLHMAMHLGLHEQRATDRPAGIREALEQLQRRTGDRHAAEHEAMECLGEALWRAQAAGRPPDEEAYLDALRRRAAPGRRRAQP